MEFVVAFVAPRHAFLQTDDTSQRCLQACGQEAATGGAAAGGSGGLGGRVRLHPVLAAPTALRFVPTLSEHPRGAGGGPGDYLSPVLRAGGQSGPAAEARHGSDQQASAERYGPIKEYFNHAHAGSLLSVCVVAMQNLVERIPNARPHVFIYDYVCRLRCLSRSDAQREVRERRTGEEL